LARSLREQIDWARVRHETAQSPYAEAFLVLLDRLQVVPLTHDAPPHPAPGDQPTAARQNAGQRSEVAV
jgi:hypothetical protein